MNRGISAWRASLYTVCFTSVTALNSEEENDPPTYKEAFPPLPEKAPCLEAAQEPSGPWSKIRPIKASVITQVGGSRHPMSSPFSFFQKTGETKLSSEREIFCVSDWQPLCLSGHEENCT